MARPPTGGLSRGWGRIVKSRRHIKLPSRDGHSWAFWVVQDVMKKFERGGGGSGRGLGLVMKDEDEDDEEEEEEEDEEGDDEPDEEGQLK